MRRFVVPVTLCVALLLALPLAAKGKKAKGEAPKSPWAEASFSGLALRGLGPALMSGRIGDLAVDPTDPRVWYVAVASGGLWKTTNAGTTFAPIFDGQGSYSIGCVTVDPNNPLTVWVGTGENNSQRSVSYGDGVYKSIDGGQSWQRVGLEQSEHIGLIAVDPRDSDVVWVASQGPLWASGGDRGLYKTVDGGKSWERVLHISDDTGISEVHLDPRDPDVVYASAYQRRRHQWTLIDGGPESGLHKSVDGGKSWKEIDNGLPEVDLGRIGIDISPANPDVLYAIVEAAGDEGGFFRSQNAGASWEKRSDYVSGSPQYYQELVADPQEVGRVYSMDTFLMLTEDGGATFRRVEGQWKHVDNHALWIDPEDTRHLIAGCDGGVYESFDRTATWHYKANLPITQFYRVAIDDDRPFYNLYGGTQDNATLGGPSRTTSAHGITNEDWFVTVFGDGFETQVDPTDPDIVYSQYQYGGLVRYDRKTGEMIDIQPQPEPGVDGLRWNWDSPLIISPHDPARLYFGANVLFRSDDRGQSWRAVSGDLTRQLDRNQLEVMGRIQSIDAVAKNASTSIYGNLVALSESTRVEGLLYVGTDDGLLQVAEPGVEGWRKVGAFPGVPELSYVSDLEASLHDDATLFVAFNNHKQGDFKPYLLKSTDRGRSFTSIAGDLPERGSVWTVAEDHVDPDLLFAGTEFGLFFSRDGGKHWVRLQGGLPPIAVRDLEIQRRENDLVLATFGRGFYILDDYSPLRGLTPQRLKASPTLFAVKDAPMFIPRYRLGIRGKAFQGDSYYAAPNPPFGAVFTYHLPQGLETRREQRHVREKEAREEGEPIEIPDWETLRAEDREEPPTALLVVRDAAGQVVRRIPGPVGAGFHRVAWDLRWPAFEPVRLGSPGPLAPWASPPEGPLVVPGSYRVELQLRREGRLETVGEAQSFDAQPIGAATLGTDDRDALLAFQMRTGELQRAVLGSSRALDEVQGRIDHLKQAILDTPQADAATDRQLREIDAALADLQRELLGDRTRARRFEPVPPSIVSRVQQVVWGHWASTSAPTETHRTNYDIAAAAFGDWLPRFRALVEERLEPLERALEAAGAPWTPGRIPSWEGR